MATTGIFVLSIIIAAFAVFGIVLAWGDHQTRNLRREVKQGRAKEGRSNMPESAIRVEFGQAAKAGTKSDLTKAA